eukprot:jgi/Chlat1/5948/Chrsp4S06419
MAAMASSSGVLLSRPVFSSRSFRAASRPERVHRRMLVTCKTDESESMSGQMGKSKEKADGFTTGLFDKRADGTPVGGTREKEVPFSEQGLTNQGLNPLKDQPFGESKGTDKNPQDVSTAPGAIERINGRAAMIGFVIALGVEVFTRASVFEQLSSSSWARWAFFAVIGLATLSTLVPPGRGVGDREAERDAPQPFKPGREIVNGRAAMIGFAALLIVEALKGGALISL